MLVGWLTKAAAVFGKVEAAPEPFDVACECGGSVSGLRAPLQQKLGCPRCGRPIWVLPGNVYPPISPARRTPAKIRSSNTVAADEPGTATPRRRTSNGAGNKSDEAPRKAGGSVQSTTLPREATAAPAANPPASLSPLQIAARGRRRTFRVVVATMVALVAVTGWSLWNRQRREQARTSVPLAAESGLIALRAGNFAEADRQLGSAVRGLDLIHQHDQWAETVRRAAREANAARNLSPSSILELTAEMLSGSGTADERRRQFQSLHGGQWMIWDVGVVRKSDSSGTTFELDAPFVLDDQPLQVACDFSELHQAAAEATSITPERVIFAAQIDHWIVPEEGPQPVIAVLNSSTAFLWTDYDSYAAAGYHPTDAEDEQKTRDILTLQSRQVLP